MPTYQYACTSDDCGLRFERVQAFTDPAITECPDCSERVRKVYGSVGVVFKGSGFYRNDSRDAKVGSKSDSAAKDGDAGKSTDSGKGSEAAKSGTTSSESSPAKSSGDSGSSGSSGSSGKASTPAAVAS
jgi:putative FmdB family regulatory protein